MAEWKYVMAFFLLAGNAVSDLRRREISLWLTGELTLAGLFLLWGSCQSAQTSFPFSLLPRLGMVAVFFLAAVLSSGGLGGGDVLVLLALGVLTELAEYLRIVTLGFLLCGGMGVWKAVRGRKTKEGLPLLPFLLLAFLFVEGWGRR